MPSPEDLQRNEVDGQVLLTVGSTVLFSYAVEDAGLRNLAAVTLTELGFTGRRVSQVLQISEVYVSRLRGRARDEGSAGLIRQRGRPPAFGAREMARATAWRSAGDSDIAIGDRLGVHPTTVARRLTGVPRPGEELVPDRDADPDTRQDPLPLTTDQDEDHEQDCDPADDAIEPSEATDENSDTGDDADSPSPLESTESTGSTGASRVSERIGTGTRSCRYAGAMLLHPYLDRVGAPAIFGTLSGGPARRYDDHGVLTAATLGFALGVDTVEGAKHLRRADAGAAVGLEKIPELGTLRGRLSALAPPTPRSFRRAHPSPARRW